MTEVRTRHRRWWLIGLLGLVLCGGAAAVSWWADPEQSAVGLLLAKTSPPADVEEAVSTFFPYGSPEPIKAQDFTPQLIAVLDRLTADFGDLTEEVDQTHRRLVEADPHLAAALADPHGTPLCGENPMLQIDVSRAFVPEMDALVDEYIATTKDQQQVAQQIAEPIRRVLQATLLRSTVEPEDVAVLEAAQAAGMDDPLLMLCLFRASRGDQESRFELIKQAQASRAKRTVCTSLAAMISSNLVILTKEHTNKEFHELTEIFIADTVALWRQYHSAEEHFAAQDYFIDCTNEAFDRLNANGQIALLFAVTEPDAPPVAPWLPQLLAYKLVRSAAAIYRGGDYINRVKEDDLKRFTALAQRATRHLLRAWTLAPVHPMFAGMLLHMENWAGTTSLSEDTWFRHALAARYRLSHAFAAYESSLEPKWGGSHAKQVWLAEKYVETGDIDLEIPVRAMNVFWDVGWRTAMCEPMGASLPVRRVASTLVGALKTYSREQPHPSVDGDVLAMAAILLWEAGEFEDLDWLLRVYAHQIDCSTRFHEKRLHADEMMEVVRAVLQDTSSRWLTIHRNLYGDTRRLSASSLEQTQLAIAEAKSLDDRSRGEYSKLLDSCERRVRLLRRLMDGEVVTLSDEELQDWVAVGRSITIDFPHSPELSVHTAASALEVASDPGRKAGEVSDDAVAARSGPPDQQRTGTVDIRVWMPDRRGLLVCPVQVDLPLRVSADVEEIEGGDDLYGVSLMVGPSMGETEGYAGPVVNLNSGRKQAISDEVPGAYWERGARAIAPYEERPKHTLMIEAFPDGYRTFFNGDELTTVGTRLKTGGMVQLGRFTSRTYPYMPKVYATYRISNVRLQRLGRTSAQEVPAS